MAETKDYGPADMILNNVRAFRQAAEAHRADAARSMQRAVEADARADEWQAFLEKANG